MAGANTTKEYLIKTVYDAAGIQKFVSDTEKAKTVATQLGLKLNETSRIVDQSVSTSFNKAGQTVRNVTTTFEQAGQKTAVSFKEIAGQVGRTDASLKNFGNTTQKAEIDLGKLISRAAVTIPVWFALRSAITGVFFGIRDGLQNLVSFDLALQKVKRNLSGTPEEITANFGVMKKEITDFSLKTGKSVEEISEAVKNFATIGFSFKDSLSAGLDATRLSIALFGDAGDTANAFASAMKLLVKEGANYPPVSQQISEAFALTAELAKDNKDDLGQLTSALNNFAATAKIANLSAKETITLLLTMATAGRQGANSGTILSSTFNELLQNLDKVSKAFGIEFNPATDSGFKTLQKILDITQEMSKTPAGQTQVIEKLSDVLGGQKGTKAVTSLIAMNDVLKKNLSVTGDVTRFHEAVNTVLDSESGQAQILSNSIREMGKSFVTGLVGAKDFVDVLKGLNSAVSGMTPAMKSLGEEIASIGKNLILFGALGSLGATLVGVRGILLTFPSILTAINVRLVALRIGLMSLTAGNVAAIAVALGLLVNHWSRIPLEKIKKADEANAALFETLKKGLSGKLAQVDLEKLILDIKGDKVKLGPGLNKERLLMTLTEQLDKQKNPTITPKLEIKPTVSSAPIAVISLENELNELKARLKAKGATDLQLQLLDVDFLQSKALKDADKIRDEQSKIRVQTVQKQRAIQDELLKAVEDSAKAEGASNLEAISKRIELEKSLGIERTGMDLLTQQLELQRALTEETKKTREERLKDLANLIKKTPGPFSSAFGNDMQLNSREQQLRSQAAFKGISEEQINKILNPESQINKGNSLLRDLQTGLAQPMTKSMGSLESAIDSLTQSILQQETRPLGVGVPRMPTVVVKDSSSDITKPGSKANQAIKQVIEDF
jgi:TP901 family phage tail tape measure protein